MTGQGDGAAVLYVAGSGRSGSTLLARLLDQVDGLFAAGELRYVWQRGLLEDRLCGCGQPLQRLRVLGRGAGPGLRRPRRHRRPRGDGGPALGHPPSPRCPWLSDPPPAALGADGPRLAYGWPAVQGRRRGLGMRAGGRLVEAPDLRLRPRARSGLGRPHRPPRARSQRHGVLVGAGKGPGRSRRRHAAHVGAEELVVVVGVERHRAQALPRPDALLPAALRGPGGRPREVVDALLGLRRPQGDGAPFVGERTVSLARSHTVAGNPNRLEAGNVELRADETWTRAMGRPQRALVTAVTTPLLGRFDYPLMVKPGPLRDLTVPQ